MTNTRIGDLMRAGALTMGDGYRTKRSEHGMPGFRIMRVADVLDGRICLTGTDYVSRDFARQIGPKLSHAGDVVLTTKGTVGRVSRVPEGLEQTVYSPQVCYFRIQDRETLDPRYFELWLRSDEFKRQASDRANNTDMAAYINLADVRSLELHLPSISEQRAIAEVLGALDDKIAANTKLIQAANGLADATYQQLATDPAAWRPLGQLATVTKGVSYRRDDLVEGSSTGMVTLKSITRDGRYSGAGQKPYAGVYKVGQIVSDGEIVVAQTDLTQAADVVGRAVRVPKSRDYSTLVASLDLAIIRSNGELVPEYLLGLVRSEAFRQHCRNHTSGTTVLHLGRGAIESFSAPIADLGAQERLSRTTRPLYQLVDEVVEQSERLTQTRDALLPLLMSGKLRVKDAERVVEEAI